MPVGPGKYDNLATAAREAAGAEGVVLIVVKGREGSGFSVQADMNTTLRLPQILRDMADQIQADLFSTSSPK